MPFISGFSQEGRTLGESERQRRTDEKEARRAAWKSSKAYLAFDAADFVLKIDDDLEQKKKEYDAIRAGFFGSVRAVLTRYQEKDDFLNDEVAPLLRKCKHSLSGESKQELVRKLQEGIERFTTFEKQSGIAKILEVAVFALTDEQLAQKANFDLAGLDQETIPVIASVAHEVPHRTAVVGRVVAQTEEDNLRILSQLRVPSAPIRLFNRPQATLPALEELADTASKVLV